MAVARDPHPVTVLRDADRAVRAVRDAVRAVRTVRAARVYRPPAMAVKALIRVS